jgi:hypothetical protein
MLEELLIDFRELEGEHSGGNMAEAVWETLTCFGIEDRVSCKAPGTSSHHAKQVYFADHGVYVR